VFRNGKNLTGRLNCFAFAIAIRSQGRLGDAYANDEGATSYGGREMKSLYEIPPGCICQGDGLLGMRCSAITHATKRMTPGRVRARAVYLGRVRSVRVDLVARCFATEKISPGG